MSDTLVSLKFSARIGKPNGISEVEECPGKKRKEREEKREKRREEEPEKNRLGDQMRESL